MGDISRRAYLAGIGTAAGIAAAGCVGRTGPEREEVARRFQYEEDGHDDADVVVDAVRFEGVTPLPDTYMQDFVDAIGDQADISVYVAERVIDETCYTDHIQYFADTAASQQRGDDATGPADRPIVESIVEEEDSVYDACVKEDWSGPAHTIMFAPDNGFNGPDKEEKPFWGGFGAGSLEHDRKAFNGYNHNTQSVISQLDDQLDRLGLLYHEFGHSMGLDHPDEDPGPSVTDDNIMHPSAPLEDPESPVFADYQLEAMYHRAHGPVIPAQQ